MRVLFLQERADDQIDALLFIFCQGTIACNQAGFRLVESMGFKVFDPPPNVGMADDIINRGVEIIRHPDQKTDFGFDIMVFIFVDRRLADSQCVRQALLADAVFNRLED